MECDALRLNQGKPHTWYSCPLENIHSSWKLTIIFSAVIALFNLILFIWTAPPGPFVGIFNQGWPDLCIDFLWMEPSESNFPFLITACLGRYRVWASGLTQPIANISGHYFIRVDFDSGVFSLTVETLREIVKVIVPAMLQEVSITRIKKSSYIINYMKIFFICFGKLIVSNHIP